MTTFVLAADHRNSLRMWLGSLGVPSTSVDRAARTLKSLCVQALGIARNDLQADETPMLLVDEEYGSDAIADAKARGLMVVVPVERSGQSEFLFEHGDRFGEAIESLDPSVVKALVRYNPVADADANGRSRAALTKLQAHLREHGRQFMLELLVPATAEQLSAPGARDYDEEIRPRLTVQAIEQLAADGLRPDWWKLEGCRTPSAAATVAAAAGTAATLGCLVLGRGQDQNRVLEWVHSAAAVDGFVGFAVGRTLWSDPFRAFVANKIDREEVPRRIAATYLEIAAYYRRVQQTRTVVAE